ncbi:MAG: STAS domain-containing protein [Deferribacteres bacterium]|nr:STAS domain-containing protein [candidate division KSB1 bacterium]MCB9510739.1 STAS domain-containing protein [Deferribacteres bacterium]
MMKYYEEEKASVLIIHLSGKIMEAEDLNELCKDLTSRLGKGSLKVLFDFRNVRWINSTGIGSILGCLTTLQKKGGDVRFTNLSSATKHYFHITKIDTVVKIYESWEEALADFGD